MTRLIAIAAAALAALAIVIAGISPSQAKERHMMKKTGSFAIAQQGGGSTADGYPTLGKAYDACGHGNVFVMYEELPDGTTQHHSFHCVEE